MMCIEDTWLYLYNTTHIYYCKSFEPIIGISYSAVKPNAIFF